MNRILLSEEEKKQKRHDYNVRPDIAEKNRIRNNQKYFCLGCESFYSYNRKKDHYNGFTHKDRMRILKLRNIDHIEKHLHEEINRKDKPENYFCKPLYDDDYVIYQDPYHDKWYEEVVDPSIMKAFKKNEVKPVDN
jgi:hypothetical protein